MVDADLDLYMTQFISELINLGMIHKEKARERWIRDLAREIKGLNEDYLRSKMIRMLALEQVALQERVIGSYLHVEPDEEETLIDDKIAAILEPIPSDSATPR